MSIKMPTSKLKRNFCIGEKDTKLIVRIPARAKSALDHLAEADNTTLQFLIEDVIDQLLTKASEEGIINHPDDYPRSSDVGSSKKK